KRPHDPAYDRAQAGARRLQDLQRLLVLGPPLLLRALAGPACRVGRGTPRLGPEQAGAPRGVGGGRPRVLPRLGPAPRAKAGQSVTKAEPLDEAVDHVRGPAGTPVILEYGDYECPYSRAAFRAIEQVEGRRPDGVRFAFRHFPLVDIHPHAM